MLLSSYKDKYFFPPSSKEQEVAIAAALKIKELLEKVPEEDSHVLVEFRTEEVVEVSLSAIVLLIDALENLSEGSLTRLHCSEEYSEEALECGFTPIRNSSDLLKIDLSSVEMLWLPMQKLAFFFNTTEAYLQQVARKHSLKAQQASDRFNVAGFYKVFKAGEGRIP